MPRWCFSLVIFLLVTFRPALSSTLEDEIGGRIHSTSSWGSQPALRNYRIITTLEKGLDHYKRGSRLSHFLIPRKKFEEKYSNRNPAKYVYEAGYYVGFKTRDFYRVEVTSETADLIKHLHGVILDETVAGHPSSVHELTSGGLAFLIARTRLDFADRYFDVSTPETLLPLSVYIYRGE